MARLLVPGLRSAWGPGWWLIALLAVAGLLVSVLGVVDRIEGGGRVGRRRPRRLHRQPPVPGAGKDASIYFVFNLRYVAHGLAIGLAVLPTALLLRGRRQWWVMTAYALVLGVAELDASLWPTELFDRRYADPIRGRTMVVGVVAVLAAVAMASWAQRAWAGGLAPNAHPGG